ncbi:ABC1 kinase family protein [Tropicimonas isoalkanivorans]|uniref:Predicted unusual protein kinase regulating ubiquinone biosynthesis, AarF/ABC1/UbiB family n=1 Tax=Tropicimonas isoalkanivorans TaxID=441112 RepID=A0A1I1EDX6_9RHOB|nr:AarF/ABC1/UbiB kinase family protein [Tropicimonas isoalkanivorans]SFB85315.1 Predicted unusual protein kinase regulating ubiquinone biosynthesis, AarF/ABC1/UbiB family [Tropicimonas isoalkanivorans]
MAEKDRTASRHVPAGRLSRLHRLGAMATGVAGNVAAQGISQWSRGQRPDLRQLLLSPGNAARVADDLARMRGAAMKVGQLVSMEAGDVLPPDLAAIFSRLQASADPMPPKQLERVLRSNWGEDWRGDFAHFDPRPIAAASIGQVHKATLRDGRTLAIKVQYPGVARSIDADIANIGTLIRMSGMLSPGFDIAHYLEEGKRQLRLEADYRHEAAQLAAYAALVGETEGFEIPTVAEQWSTGEVLAMSFHESRPIEWLTDASQEERDRVIARLIDLVLREIFEFGLVQTDPNFANYRYDPGTGRVVLLDFGATRSLPPQIIDQCREMLAAGLAGDRPGLERASAALGVLPEAMAPDHRAQILSMMEIAFADARREVFDFAESDLLARLRTEGRKLAADRMPPPEIPMDALFLQRKIGGTFLLATRLRARVPLRSMFAAFV